MDLMRNFNRYFNPFSKYFLNSEDFTEDHLEQLQQNAVAVSDLEYQLANSGIPHISRKDLIDDSAIGAVDSRQYNLINQFNSKFSKVAAYRGMADFPEISDGIDFICNDAIVEDDNNRFFYLHSNYEFPKRIQRLLEDEFDYIHYNIFSQSDNQLYDLFYKGIVDSELALEWILQDDGKGIIGYNTLPAFSIFPVYVDNYIDHFIQVDPLVATQSAMNGFNSMTHGNNHENHGYIKLNRDQICYINMGRPLTGSEDFGLRGVLEPAMKTYNQLRAVEDALVIFRLARAPEKRIWNVELGQIPPPQRESFLNRLIQRYKKKFTMDPKTGETDQIMNTQNILEDYWFGKINGEGTTIDLLQSSMNLGNLDDVVYLVNKLYRSMKIPKSRWDSTNSYNYSSGKEIEREEIKFNAFVKYLQNKFKQIIKDCFVTHLRLKYRGDTKIFKFLFNIENFIDIRMNEVNYFKEYKELELFTEKSNLIQTLSQYWVTADQTAAPLSVEWILRHPAIGLFNDETWKDNLKLRKREQQIIAKTLKTQAEHTDDQEDQTTPVNFGRESDEGLDNDLSKSNYEPEPLEDDEEEPKLITSADDINDPIDRASYITYLKQLTNKNKEQNEPSKNV